MFAIEKLRPYIEGTHFTVITDHYCLKWLNNIKDPVGRIARWAIRLQQYDFEIVHRKGKDNVVPDVLSRSVPIVDAVTDVLPAEFTTEDCSKDRWYVNMLDRVKADPMKYPLWRIEHGLLYRRVHIKYDELLEEQDRWLLVVPKQRREAIMKSHHDPPICGHLGVFKTTARILQKCY